MANPVRVECTVGTWKARAWRDSSFLGGEESNGAQAIQIPQQPAGTRITARLFSNNAGTATAQVNIKGHYYG